jgi:hypothetical protein
MKSFFAFVFLSFSIITLSVPTHAHSDHGQLPAGHLVYKQNTLHVHAQFLNQPEINKEALLVLETRDPRNHQIIEIEDSIEVVLWMPSMGHGSAPTQVERQLDAQGNVVPGVFRVRNVYFSMGGLWEIRVGLTDVNGVLETKSFTLNLAGGGHGGHN